MGALDTERQSVFVLSAIVNRVPQHLYFRHLRVCISQIFPFVFLQTLAQYLLHSTAVTLHSLSPKVSADKQSFPLNFVFSCKIKDLRSGASASLIYLSPLDITVFPGCYVSAHPRAPGGLSTELSACQKSYSIA